MENEPLSCRPHEQESQPIYPHLLENIDFQVKKEASTQLQFSATFYLLTKLQV